MVVTIAHNRPLPRRDVYYYRQRLKNRIHSSLLSFYDKRALEGTLKKDIAFLLEIEPSQVTRWLREPSNLTLETISDLLLAMDGEPEPLQVTAFEDIANSNYAPDLIAYAHGIKGAAANSLPAPKASPSQVNSGPPKNGLVGIERQYSAGIPRVETAGVLTSPSGGNRVTGSH